MKKALVIAPQPFFSPRGTPFSVYYRTAVMAEKEIEIDLLTYGEGEDVDIPHVNIIRIPRFRFLGNVKIGPSLLKLFLDAFILLWTIRLLQRKKYDFVHAHEESVFFCRFLKPFFKFKMVYDMHSSLPQQLSNFQYTESKRLIDIFHKLENASLQAADAVITICPDLYEYVNGIISRKEKHLLIENSLFESVRLKSKVGGASAPSTGMHLGGDMSANLPSSRNLVVYIGTLEPYQGIDLLIGAFREVVRKKPDAFLLIVGGTVDQVTLYRKMARELGVESRSMFTGRVPQAHAKEYMKAASILVSPRSSGTNTPLKIYEYLASGIPIVATDIHSHTQVIDDEVAFLVKPEIDSMARGLLEAMDDPAGRAKIVAGARKLYEERYSRRIYEAKIDRLLEILA